MAAQSLSQAIQSALAFLTDKLAPVYSPATLIKLRMILDANLTAHYAPSWVPSDPMAGSSRRCLSLTPTTLPPRPIWSACVAANVQWFDWISHLGNFEFDLYVDPGSVVVRAHNKILTVWSDGIPPPVPTAHLVPALPVCKTFAQKLVEEDVHEEEKIFTLLAEQMSAPVWLAPVTAQFTPIPARSSSPLSSISEQSRCSSRSSNSSSSTFSSADSGSSVTGSKSSVIKPSRRERARQARVFIDKSKVDVTPYDGGKTTVLTGGVMLGGGGGPKTAIKPKHMAAPNPAINTNSWRSVRG